VATADYNTVVFSGHTKTELCNAGRK
jgi:hypothetical protein